MATKLIADIVEAPTIKLTSGAVDGYFLKTDSDGNATWTPISASQVYKGTWDADTNTPTLADSTGVQGHYYRVTTAGTSDLDDSGSSGNKSISYDVGDDVIHNGTFWERIPGVGYTLQTATDAVLGGVKIGSGVIISNGIISVSTDAETLDGFDSTNFVRATGSVVETINGEKTFSSKILIPNGSGIKGSTETGLPGSNSSSFYSFYQSNGTTRKGYIGFPITMFSDLSIRNDASNKSLTLRENGNLDYNGDVTAQNFIGNGSQITNVDAATLDSLDSNDFLRSNTSDNFSGSALTINDNSQFKIGGTSPFGNVGHLKYQATGTTLIADMGADIIYRDAGSSFLNRFIFSRGSGNFRAFGDVTAQNFIGNGSRITNVDASSLNGLSIAGANANIPWPFIPDVGADGLMEIGRYIDFHLASNSGVDNNGRLALTSDKNLDWSGDFTADNFFEGSDKRLKTNIKKISKSVYSYELKTQPGITVYGTIAQEIEKINPEVVKKPEDDGMMSVNYNSFLSLKLAEQENENKEQNNKIDSLQQQIDELKELIKN